MPVLKVKHNGEWINVGGGGASGGSNVNIDPTLTQSGSAADAKASGDAIRNLNTLVGNKPVAEQIQDAIDNLEVSGGGEGIAVQADWDQTNSNKLDFIKNKPFYDAGQPYEFSIFNQENMNFAEVPNMDESGTMNIYMPETYEEEMALGKLQFVAGNTYTIIIDGISYSAQAKSFGGDMTYLGNLNLAISVYPSAGENFLIIPSEMMFIVNDSISSHNIAITETRLVVQKEIVPQNTYSFPCMDSIMYINLTDFDFSGLRDGDQLIINYNGKEYSCNVTAFEMGLIFGNGSIIGFSELGNNEPFIGLYAEGMSGMYAFPTEIPFRVEKIISDTETEVIIPEDTPYNVYIQEGIYYDFTNPTFVIEPETSYKVFWNNVEYTCVSFLSDEGGIELQSNTDVELPFFFVYYKNSEDELFAYFEVYSGGPEVLNKEIQISGLVSGVKKLDKKYIPDDIDLPIASYNRAGAVKVYDAQSGLGSSSDYTPIYLDTDDNQIYAKARSSMSTLTFTGATSGSYNGSSPVTINIPTALKNPNALTFTGGVTGTYDGSFAKTVAIPTTLKNPYSLTFSGAVSGSYDGSSSKSVYIPTVPSSLKNPYSLTFTGGATESYDGSSSKTVEIPIVPTSLKNPNALTFTGLIEGSYDGSEAVTIEIPTGVPEVTTDNNGQILQVVDGTWVNNNPVFNYTTYIDQGNGYKYYVYVYNGELVIKAEYTGIEVTTMPTTREYHYGEIFDPIGMVVNAVLADGSTKTITDYTYYAPEYITENTTIKVSWNDEFGNIYTTTFEVRVIECTGIEITTMPTKTEYFAGQVFDPTGMVITATYADGSTKVVTNYTYSANLTVDNPTVTISYAKNMTTFDVTVYDPNAEFIDFTYTTNDDSVTLNTWKGTLNGNTSTECVIPDGNGIINVII